MIRCCVQTGPDSLCFEVALIVVMINQCICLSAAGGNCAGCLAFGGVLVIAQKYYIGKVERSDWRRGTWDVIEIWISQICTALCKTSFDWERHAELIRDNFAFIYSISHIDPTLQCVHKQIMLIWFELYCDGHRLFWVTLQNWCQLCWDILQKT